tara:strand:- start:207 stop:470 length:264 start_codon:yes stop_codon:yes gene_type:complete
MSKLEEKELKPLQENQNKINQVITNLGFSVLQKHGIKKNRKSLISEMEKLDKQQQDLKKELEDSYGKISVNLQTGEYEDIKEDDNIK